MDSILGYIAVAVLVIFMGIGDFFAGLKDPCYEKFVVGKGTHYEIKKDRVCMQYTSGGGWFNEHTAKMKTLKGANAKTFKKIDGGYFIDKDNVYSGRVVVANADPQSFSPIGNGYYKDNTSIFYNGNNISADYKTFQVLEEKYGIGKDKFAVYQGGRRIRVQDSSNFEMLDDHYAKDQYSVYHKGMSFVTLEGANPNTFTVLGSASYAKDDERVYYYGKLILEADAQTFRTFGKFSQDKKYIYHNEKPLKNIDSENYELVGSAGYIKDIDSLYYYDKEILGVSVQDFEIISYQKKPSVWRAGSCGTDGKVVICHGSEISGGEIIEEV